MMIRNALSIKAEAMGLIVGIGDEEWKKYLSDLVNQVDAKKLNLDWDKAYYPLPKQLRNPAVVKEYRNGEREYVSSQLWLRLTKAGSSELLVPEETSGVLLEGETGKVLKPFNGLPLVTPDDTDYLIRIHIRESENKTGQSTLDMSWHLYGNTINQLI